MATYRLPILNSATKPDNNGNTYPDPLAVNFSPTNKRYDVMLTAFTSQSARQGIAGKFAVPKNYVGTAKIVVVWSTTATSGDVVWDFDYTAVGGDTTETLDPSTDQESVTGTDSAAATARRKQDLSINLTSANLAVDDQVLFNFFRDGADAADTLAATAYLFDLFFEYADV